MDKNLIDIARKLISNGETEEALNQLEKVDDAFLLLKGEFKSVRNDYINSIIEYGEFNTLKARISHKVLIKLREYSTLIENKGTANLIVKKNNPENIQNKIKKLTDPINSIKEYKNNLPLKTAEEDREFTHIVGNTLFFIRREGFDPQIISEYESLFADLKEKHGAIVKKHQSIARKITKKLIEESEKLEETGKPDYGVVQKIGDLLIDFSKIL